MTNLNTSNYVITALVSGKKVHGTKTYSKREAIKRKAKLVALGMKSDLIKIDKYEDIYC